MLSDKEREVTFDGVLITPYIKSWDVTYTPVFVMSCPHRPPCQQHCPKAERIDVATDVRLELSLASQSRIGEFSPGGRSILKAKGVISGLDQFEGYGVIATENTNMNMDGCLYKYTIQGEQRIPSIS